MSSKPVVNFTEYLDGTPAVGHKTIIRGVSNHPNNSLNGNRPVMTSTVRNIISEDEFETTNTIYRKIK